MISEYYVLSSRKCVETAGKILHIRIGNENHFAEQLTIDDNFNRNDYKNRLKNNLILIQLRFPVSFSDGVCPICLPNKQNIPLYSSGFQIHKSNGIETKKAQLEAVSCEHFYPNVTINLDEMFCARYSDKTFRGIQGAPIQSFDENKLRINGIIAVSQPKKVEGTVFNPQPVPVLFTRTYPFINWIESVVWSEEL